MNANDNIGMKMSELVMWISEFQLYTWVMLNSLMFRITDYLGSQWAILNRSEQTDPLQALPTAFACWMGLRITPFNASELVS